MLHLDTVESGTLELIRQLQEDIPSSFLVGGTSLALRKGYRKSVDIVLFLREEFDSEALSNYLFKKYKFYETFRRNCTLKGFIENVKIDIIRYDYDFVAKPDIIEGVRMLSIPDIIAMKLAVITDNGTRVKDFVDIAYLSTEYSLQQMVSFFNEKFPQKNSIQAVMALTYYTDIDHSDTVNLIGHDYKWQDIKTRLESMTQYFEKIFSQPPCQKTVNEGKSFKMR